MFILLYAGKYEGWLMLNKLIDIGRPPSHIFILKGSSYDQEWSQRIKKRAEDKGIDYTIAPKMNSETVRQIIKRYKPCLFFFSNCRQLLNKKTIDLIDWPINFHNSLLPAYRGFAPNVWPIINGEKYTGTTMLKIVPGPVDSGPIIAQKRIVIRESDTGWSLEKKLAMVNVNLMEKFLPALISGKVKMREQDETKATYACKRTPNDGLINWSWTSERIHNLVRALTRPYPGAFTFIQGRKLYVWEVKKLNCYQPFVGRIPGAVIKIGRVKVSVLSGDGICELSQVQLEGDKVRPAAEIIKSLDIRLGK